MLEAFGGVPRAIVPDNLKAGVSRPCDYEPTIHPTYGISDQVVHFRRRFVVVARGAGMTFFDE
jgi:hypothetical protein